MIKNLLFSVIVCLLIFMSDFMKDEQVPEEAIHRSRMFKFAVCQDFFVLLSVLKMIVFENTSANYLGIWGYTLTGVVDRIRNAGPLTQLYVATSAVLHTTLLLDEDTDQSVRLNPAPYVPPTIEGERADLFLL